MINDCDLIVHIEDWGLAIGDWRLGIGDWAMVTSYKQMTNNK
ncbi:hypothetical protein [Scytonema sp. UIC 10036]|nr:hypothetical protein [Scytonema sp. UIC 10036]